MNITERRPTAHPSSEVEAICRVLNHHPNQSRAALFMRLRCPHWSSDRQAAAQMEQQATLNSLIAEGVILERKVGPTKLLSIADPDYGYSRISPKSKGLGDRSAIQVFKPAPIAPPKAKAIIKVAETVLLQVPGTAIEFTLLSSQKMQLEAIAAESQLPSMDWLLLRIIENWLLRQEGKPALTLIPEGQIKLFLPIADQRSLIQIAELKGFPNVGEMLSRIVKTWLMTESSQRRD